MVNWNVFDIRVPGKWVLAGEHSVLRGGSAVALPHPEFSLGLSFRPQPCKLEIEPKSGQEIIEELLDAVEGDFASQGRAFIRPRGKLKIESSIPMGAGLGSSAALCVALSKWMTTPFSLNGSEVAGFATRMENRFHGKSSGMDVSAILAGVPILFSREKGPISLKLKKLPTFNFHDSGLRAETSRCIEKVEQFGLESPAAASEIDRQMDAAAKAASQALLRFDSERNSEALADLAQAMKSAHACFVAWGLVPQKVLEMESTLYSQGALAVKLTGAGGGGSLVSLWESS
jgi:mevalonate kinase